MPRKANPDPLSVEYTSAAGAAWRIQAYRNGSWRVLQGERQVYLEPAAVNRGYGSPRWPSNRLQEQAIAEAKNWIEVFGHRQV